MLGAPGCLGRQLLSRRIASPSWTLLFLLEILTRHSQEQYSINENLQQKWPVEPASWELQNLGFLDTDFEFNITRFTVSRTFFKR